MTQEQLKFNPNPLVAFLEKPMAEFTKADILKVIEEFQIEMLNFRYMADDGKLHTLNFVIQSLAHADEVLTSGERVDGSSLFPYIEAGNSDLYVIPRFRTAFLDPFSETCCVLSSTRTENLLHWLPNTRCRRRHEPSVRRQAVWTLR